MGPRQELGQTFLSLTSFLVRDKKTGKSKGFAFLCYENQLSTVLSVDNLNSIKLCGRTIRVDHVEEYRVPKMREDMAPEQQKLALEGCAPAFISPATPESSSPIQRVDGPNRSSHKKHKRKDKSPSHGDILSSEQKSCDDRRRNKPKGRSPGRCAESHHEETKREPLSVAVGEALSETGSMIDGVLLPPRLFGAPIKKELAAPEKSSSNPKKSKKNKKVKKENKNKKKKEKKKKKKKRRHSHSTSNSSSSSSDDDSPLQQSSRRKEPEMEKLRDSKSHYKVVERSSVHDLSSGRVKIEPLSDVDDDARPSHSATLGSCERAKHGFPNYKNYGGNHQQLDDDYRERKQWNDREHPRNGDKIYGDKRRRDVKDCSRYDDDKYSERRQRESYEDDDAAARRSRNHDDRGRGESNYHKRWRGENTEGHNSRDTRNEDGDYRR
ncbi:RNA recognition motif domain [Trinorchestia longiramus]|nr:RNA recognition motif domain [Trinorchestia longiramus]